MPQRTRSLQARMLNDTGTLCHTISQLAGGHTADIKRHQVNQYPLHRHQQLCVRLHRLQRAYNNVAPVYCRNALDHCKHACQMTPARSATRSASLRVTIEQISTIRRSIGVHRSAIRCNVHDCIDLYGVEYPGSCCNDAMMWIVPVDDSGGL